MHIFSGYDKTVGGVERIMPSICGSKTCAPGYSGDECQVLEKDKIPPTVEYCPPGMILDLFLNFVFIIFVDFLFI